MENDIVVALVAFAGTLAGTFGGIVTSSKLTAFRLRQLEERVQEHNQYARRMPVVEEQIKSLNHRVGDLERREVNG